MPRSVEWTFVSRMRIMTEGPELSLSHCYKNHRVRIALENW